MDPPEGAPDAAPEDAEAEPFSLTVDHAAALVQDLRKGGSSAASSLITPAQLQARLQALTAADEATAIKLSQSLARVFGDADGHMEHIVLGCGVGLLSAASASEKLRLAFYACDPQGVGFVTLQQVAQFIKAFASVVVTAVETMVAAAVDVMRAPPGLELAQMLIQEAAPAMKLSASTLSRSAKDLRLPHGINVCDFQAWALAHNSVAMWASRLSAVWAHRILGIPAPIQAMGGTSVVEALTAADDELNPDSVATLVASVWSGNAAVLRDRLYAMHAPETGQRLDMKQACLPLTMLAPSMTGAEVLASVCKRQGLEGPGTDGISPSSVLKPLQALSREVADGVLLSCSLLVCGRPRGGISRAVAFERLDPCALEAVDRLATQVLQDAADEAGALTGDTLASGLCGNAGLVSWVESLQQQWPWQCQLYNRTFSRSLRAQFVPSRAASDPPDPALANATPEEASSAVRIQAVARGKAQREMLKIHIRRATILQSVWRMMQARRRAKRVRDAQIEANTWDAEKNARDSRIRRNEAELLAMKQVPAKAVQSWSLSRRHDAAVRIQANFRAHGARVALPQQREAWRRKQAATAIQACARKWLRQTAIGAQFLQKKRHRPRLTAHMTDETIARWQNVIHSRRKHRGQVESLWRLRRTVQQMLEKRALCRMEREERRERREHLVVDMPNRRHLLMAAPNLDAIQSNPALVEQFPTPPATRLETARASHISLRRQVGQASLASKSPAQDSLAVACMNQTAGDILHPVLTSDRDDMEAELRRLRKSLTMSELNH
jgi:hypothetical protein